MLKWLKIWTLLTLGIILMLVTPVLAQDTAEQGEDGGQDTSMVFGDGQDGSGNTDYDYDALVKELYGREEDVQAEPEPGHETNRSTRTSSWNV